MPHVTLFGHTYVLPAVANDRFCRLRQQVNIQSESIQESRQPSSGWRRLVQRSESGLNAEQRFQELSLLIQNYEAIVDELGESQDAYQFFFAQLAAGVRHALEEKRTEMRSLEQERRASYQEALAQQDEGLQKLALEDEQRLLQGVRLLGQAALLLLKKIAVCQHGIARLAEDQELQRQVLSQLIGHVDRHHQAYQRRQRIDKIVREVAEMAQVALVFEGYMREHLGPLQDLLDKVGQVDDALHGAVTEIEDISRQMLQNGMLLLPNATTDAVAGRTPPLESQPLGSQLTSLDQRVLDCLISFQLQKESLAAVWQRLELQDGSAEALDMDIVLTSGAETTRPVLTALDNIQTLVDMRLSPLIAGQENALQTPLAPLDVQLVTPTTSLAQRERRKSTSLWHQMATAAAQFSEKILASSPGLELEFVLIEAGTFAMGSTVFADEQPVHEVRISRPFYLAKYPVTQAQWQALMGKNPSHFRGDPDRPVENVSWEEVQAFITRLNEREGRLTYRLPTEAEWEYAARAETTTDYCFGQGYRHLSTYAWYAPNAAGRTQPVGQRKPNAWGLYDMHGNVWEWVLDWYAEAYDTHSVQADPHGPAAGLSRVVRGGGWDCHAGDCRSASRNAEPPAEHTKSVGFRVVRKFP